MRLLQAIGAIGMTAGLVTASPSCQCEKRSPQPEFTDGKYLVDRQVSFDNSAFYSFESGVIPEGLWVSDYVNGPTHQWNSENVVVRDGYMDLTVPGGQAAMPYSCAEVVTVAENIKYASVRTVGIFSEPWGVCNGIFFYKSDNQETDIEWLSDPNNDSNAGTRRLWLTNQDTNGDGKTYLDVDPPADPTNTEHEYRIDWTEGRVAWFVDGEQVWETDKDVPSVAGPWVWNNWSNGDQGWSAGPPAEDAVFRIKSIEMYYNTV